MSMAYIRETYAVLAKRGALVRIQITAGNTVEGRITSAKGGHLMIRRAGDRRSRKYHPTFGIDYSVSSSGASSC